VRPLALVLTFWFKLYPPGRFPKDKVNGTRIFSTFAQRYTGMAPNGVAYTIGDVTTPSGAYSIPSSSNCVTTSTVANGVDLASLALSSSATATPSVRGAGGLQNTRTTSGLAANTTGSGSSGPSGSSGTADADMSAQMYPKIALWVFLSGIGTVVLFQLKANSKSRLKAFAYAVFIKSK